MIEEVGINEQQSLEGLIDKIFDKALTDTHFSELYANMCKVGIQLTTQSRTLLELSPNQHCCPTVPCARPLLPATPLRHHTVRCR